MNGKNNYKKETISFIVLDEAPFHFLQDFKGIKMTTISERELEQTRAQMLRFAELQLHHTDLAEDLVQEAFLSAFKNLANFKLLLKPGFSPFSKTKLSIIYAKKDALC